VETAGTGPCSGWVQRSRASTPMTAPLAVRTIGW
jgi:hypothetical protein